jgi:hypothetical protein
MSAFVKHTIIIYWGKYNNIFTYTILNLRDFNFIARNDYPKDECEI